jgi:hypothetical protein
VTEPRVDGLASLFPVPPGERRSSSPADGDAVQVRARTIAGVQCTIRMTVLGELATPGTQLPTRLVAVDGGPPLLQKWVSRTESGEPGPLDALDREILATHRFALTFWHRAYPAELPRLWYYSVDSNEPFVLLELYRGRPVAEVLQWLGPHDRYQLQLGLLRALQLAGWAGTTHGRVSLETLRWDSRTRTVQLTDFEQASPLGGHNANGWPVDVRDDVRDAGLAIWRVSYPAHTGSSAPDLMLDGGALANPLAGVFVDPPAARPTLETLLGRLSGRAEPPVASPGVSLREGQQAFDQLLDRKRARQAAEQARDKPHRTWWPKLLTGRASTGALAYDSPQKLVRCPVCQDSYPWQADDELWRYDEEQQHYVQVEVGVQDPMKEENLLRHAYRRCPNPSEDSAEHYLPAVYHAFDPPLVVAMIGRPAAGKTHLLAAMIREIVEHHGLNRYGLTTEPLDLHRHAGYRRSVLQPVEHGAQLPGTREHVTDPAEILLIRGPSGTRPVVFFDVAGEDLQAVGEGDKLARFLIGTGAVIFVHGLEPTPERIGNRAFEMSLIRLRVQRDVAKLPAAIVATKSDRLRYLPPVARWLRRDLDPLPTSVDASMVLAESRDAYAFLHYRGEHAALAPFEDFDRCTLHFASASGSEAAPDGKGFVRGFEPSRALQPLIAILAMAGVIDSDQARRVGR